ncbi:DKNYY domain-containing protein [Polystyrenella longa]|nr:DKNYY domain-containing protein [Polystyrenella longa]
MLVMDDVQGELVVLKDHRYAKTEKNVYILGVKIHDADPATFTTLEYPFSRDKNHVYCGSLYLIDADPDGFKLLFQNAMFGMLDRFKKEPFIAQYGEHPALGHEKRYCTKSAWSTDGKTIYFGYAKVKNANPNTFTALDGLYGKDDMHVFSAMK